MTRESYECSRCGHDDYQVGELRAAGGFWSKIFDVQGQKFTTVICKHCRHTELYQADTGTLSNVFDFLTQ